MTGSASDAQGSHIVLLPHQVRLVETCFAPGSERVVLVRAGLQTGLVNGFLGAIRRCLEQSPDARILYLIPNLRMLMVQTEQRLAAEDLPSLLVDHYSYRELLDASNGPVEWPSGCVTIVGLDLARHLDLAASLAACDWALAFVNGSDRGPARRADVLQAATRLARRVVVALPLKGPVPHAFAQEPVTTVIWKRADLVGLDGQALFPPMEPILHETRYPLLQEETALRTAVQELCHLLAQGEPRQKAMARALLKSSDSSPSALEREVRNLMKGVDFLEDWPEDLDASDAEDPGVQEPMGEPSPMKPQVAAKARALLDQVENLPSDAKAEAFGALLQSLVGGLPEARRVCVVTEARATLFSLAAECEGLGIGFQVLHGGMTLPERQMALDGHREGGKVLVASLAVLSDGLDLARSTDLILYDLPDHARELQLLLGRFLCLGRTKTLTVHLLTPDPLPGKMGHGLMERLQRMLMEAEQEG